MGIAAFFSKASAAYRARALIKKNDFEGMLNFLVQEKDNKARLLVMDHVDFYIEIASLCQVQTEEQREQYKKLEMMKNIVETIRKQIGEKKDQEPLATKAEVQGQKKA